jgi:hypothetical protein
VPAIAAQHGFALRDHIVDVVDRQREVLLLRWNVAVLRSTSMSGIEHAEPKKVLVRGFDHVCDVGRDAACQHQGR